MLVFAAPALCVPYDINTFLLPAWMATTGAALLAVWTFCLWLVVPRLHRMRLSSDVAWVLRISGLLAGLGAIGAAGTAGWIWMQANAFPGWCFPLTANEEVNYDLWHYNLIAQQLGPDILAGAVGLVLGGGLALGLAALGVQRRLLEPADSYGPRARIGSQFRH